MSVPLVTLVACALASNSPAPADNTPPTSVEAPVTRQPLAEIAALPDVADRAVGAVVNIRSTRVQSAQPSPFQHDPFFRHFFGPQTPRALPEKRRAQSLGSGVVVDASRGIVLTNNHVIAEADEVEISLQDGETFEAKVVGTDPKSDLAVLEMVDPPASLVALPFGDSDDLRLGEIVLAIGNPFGLANTVTMGIVSAKGRANVGIVDYEDFIQTDAAINPGNSGGALVNRRGELVGINTAIYSKSGGYQGIGFAIPTDMAQPILQSILANGTVVRGYLGVMIQDIDADLREALDLDSNHGILVGEVVEGGPADRAGFRSGDVILSFDGEVVDDVARFRTRIAALGGDVAFEAVVDRQGKRKTLEGKLGVLDAPAEDDDGQIALAAAEGAGVLVERVDPESPFARAGLRRGDVIMSVARKRVDSPEAFHQHWKRSQGRVLLQVQRASRTHFIVVRK